MKTKILGIALAFILFSFSVIGQKTVFTSPKIPPKTIDASQSYQNCCGDNVIQVNGEGKVKVQPDIAILNIGIRVTERTSALATSNTNTKINQINAILSSNKVSKNDIQTAYLTINPEYNYDNGNAVLVGQTASQTLTITLRNIGTNGQSIGKLVDEIANIDGIQVNGLNFDKENKSQAFKQSRKLAFNDAKSKAADLASLSDRILGKVIKIVDSSTAIVPPPVIYRASLIAMSDSSSNTSVQPGQISVTYNLNVKFGIL